MSIGNTGQQAKKSFVITMNGELSADQLQADLNTWLDQRKASNTPPSAAEVKQVHGLEYASTEEVQKLIKLLAGYTSSLEEDDDFTYLLYDLFSSVDTHFKDGLTEVPFFINRLCDFFLLAEHSTAFAGKSGKNKEDLKLFLPKVKKFFHFIFSSDLAQAVIRKYELKNYSQFNSKRIHVQHEIDRYIIK